MAQFEDESAAGEMKTGKAAIAERKKKRREGKAKNKEASSIVVACIKRLLPVGLNVFGGRELDIVQQSKEKYLRVRSARRGSLEALVNESTFREKPKTRFAILSRRCWIFLKRCCLRNLTVISTHSKPSVFSATPPIRTRGNVTCTTRLAKPRCEESIR